MRFEIRSLLLFVAVVAVVCALCVAARNHYYGQRRQAELVLAEAKGISNIQLHAHVDIVEEINGISFSVDGHPGSIVSLGGLGHYETESTFAVSQIGKWQFKVSGQRHLGAYNASNGEPVESQYISGYIQLGPSSPYKDLIPFEVNTLQDVVDHYAELVDLFDSWPREAEPGSLTLVDGTTQFFHVVEERE